MTATAAVAAVTVNGAAELVQERTSEDDIAPQISVSLQAAAEQAHDAWWQPWLLRTSCTAAHLVSTPGQTSSS